MCRWFTHLTCPISTAMLPEGNQHKSWFNRQKNSDPPQQSCGRWPTTNGINTDLTTQHGLNGNSIGYTRSQWSFTCQIEYTYIIYLKYDMDRNKLQGQRTRCGQVGFVCDYHSSTTLIWTFQIIANLAVCSSAGQVTIPPLWLWANTQVFDNITIFLTVSSYRSTWYP